MANELDDVRRYTDVELVSRLERLVKADRRLSAELLVHLGEVDARDAYREHGYSSTYAYCVGALFMSEAEAYLRIRAARVGRGFPVVIERFSAGDLHLSGITVLAPHITEDNCLMLLERTRRQTKRQIEIIVAELAPKPDVPARIRKLPNARRPAVASREATASSAADEPLFRAENNEQAQSTQTFLLQPESSRATTTPLSPGRFKLELTLGQEAHDKLEQLRELLRHQDPSGDLTKIIERAIDELLERTMKKRFAQTDAPAPRRSREPAQVAEAPESARTKNSRYIPRDVLREVYKRDAGQCTYVSPDGYRCAEKGFLEVHHHNTTHARGGRQTPGNLRLACRAHNALWAERDYGRTFMQNKQRKPSHAAELFPET